VNSGLGTGTHVILKDGISVFGGYSADFSERDSAAHVTKITDTSTATAPSHLNPNRAVETHGFIDTPTVLDGFTIRGSDQGNHSAAILVNGGGGPIIQHNIIQGGGTDLLKPSLFSMGVVNYDGGPTIQDNTIDGGKGNRASIAIVNGGASFYLIRNNAIDGGSGTLFAFGIWSTLDDSPGAVVRNNTIHGGHFTGSSYGVQIESSSPTIQNNTINGGSGTTVSYGIQNKRFGSSATPSNPIIENNIIITTGTGPEYCIHEIDADMDPVSLKHNDLFGCGTALYFDEGTTPLSSIAAVNSLSGATDNVSLDPNFVDQSGGNWHLTPSSPPSVSQGGLDLSPAFTTDKDGFTRTIPWSMGAYESD
jgi:hypothetical protein